MYEGTQAKLNFLSNQFVKTDKAPLYTIENGVEKVLATHELGVDATNKKKTFLAVKKVTGLADFDLSWDLFEDAAKSILLLYFFADYRRIKEHTVFRKIYGYNPHGVVNYWDGAKVVPITCETFPCMRCGLLLPANNITIDHQKPQEGGEVLAVLKSFRAIGMTQEGPKGAKGLAVAQKNTYDLLLSGLLNNNIRGPISPHPQPLVDFGNRAKRQTLSEQGAVIYSALLWGGDKPVVFKTCMHSLLNLKPMCLRCNTSKGNSILG